MAEIYNHNIKSMVEEIDRYIIELSRSTSANLGDFKAYDMIRTRSYLNALKSYHGYVIGLPELDTPESSPHLLATIDPKAPEPVENSLINELVALLVMLQLELVNATSARDHFGLSEPDSIRFLNVMARIELFISEVIEKVIPLDLPKSSPRSEVAPAGRRGT